MPDILSHGRRKNKIHILTVDEVLGEDIFERIKSDKRVKSCNVIKPTGGDIKKRAEAIEQSARDTVTSKLLIIDVRRITLSMLQQAYNKIIGYNRRDLNQLCYTILIGDGPMNLFQSGKSLEVFVPHVSSHRVDYHPAVYFYDPFIHYEPDEFRIKGVDDEFKLPSKLPERFRPYFQDQDKVKVEDIRKFFRAVGKNEQERKNRTLLLKDLYKKRIEGQFPNHKEKLQSWLTRDGIQVSSERLHLYPLYFEEWVYELMKDSKAKK